MINLKPIITASAVLLLLNACSSDSSSTGAEISVLAISGATVGLNGTYSMDCHETDGGKASAKEVLEIAGNTWNYTETMYTDADCLDGATVSTAAATLAAGANSAITGWVDGMDLPTAAPLAADGSGLLGDTESYTSLSVTVSAATGDLADIAAGTVFPLFYIVDDTGTNNMLYRDAIEVGSTLAGNFDPYTKQ